MEWTQERPTVPGHYWYIPGDSITDRRIVYVHTTGGVWDDEGSLIREPVGYWYGPITPPEFP